MAIVALHPAAKPPDRKLLEPPTVMIPSPDDQASAVPVIISPTTIEQLAKGYRRTTIFEAWAHLVGEMPPVNNAYHYPRAQKPEAVLRTIRDAHACFRGLHRPCDKEDDGEDTLVYVLETPQTVRWTADMACVVELVDVPDKTVLTIHVREAARLQIPVEGVWGAITKWEFVNADAEQPSLPIDHNTRYGRRLWT
jgi:hypothetical protein